MVKNHIKPFHLIYLVTDCLLGKCILSPSSPLDYFTFTIADMTFLHMDEGLA
jgi:hypothetical protein